MVGFELWPVGFTSRGIAHSTWIHNRENSLFRIKLIIHDCQAIEIYLCTVYTLHVGYTVRVSKPLKTCQQDVNYQNTLTMTINLTIIELAMYVSRVR